MESVVREQLGRVQEFAGTNLHDVVTWAPPDAALPPDPECYHSPDASDYRGTGAVTAGGLTCAKWTLTPPAHRIAGVLTEYDHNYCRIP